MKQVLIKGGNIIVPEVPAPVVGPRNILVRVQHSCISVGTEISGVRLSALPLYKRALKQPHHVKRVIQVMRDQGVRRTMARVLGSLASGTATGYSAAGEVVDLGELVEGFRVGDRVACAGAGVANHAEIIDVPVNLATRIPDALSSQWASTVTLGSIAMQGVRRCSPTLGETVLVMGLGILGQVTMQLLRSSGCRVIGVDPDSARVQIALANGMDWGFGSESDNVTDRIHRLTDGFGADAVIITAATSSHQVVSDAMNACRKKGRVILVGDVGLNLNRNDFYKKEIDFLISCSYGPGRYDPLYEENGNDYPIAYVRWTENRNMESYLALLARGAVQLASIPAQTYSIQDAAEAFRVLQASGPKPLLVFLSYPPSEKIIRTVAIHASRTRPGRLRVAIVGAGGFAQGMHLPNLIKLRKRFEIRGIMSRTGSNARSIALQYEGAYATTDYAEVLNDPQIDLLIICTRHNLHAQMLLAGLKAGKAVLIEKPLALTEEDLEQIEGYYREVKSCPVFMTGFNRRFSPAIQKCRQRLAGRSTPLVISYRMNAGFISPDHWVHGEEGGGRNIGEACHIYDLFTALTGSKPVSVQAVSARPTTRQWSRKDNFTATIAYADGSVCSLIYTAFGNKAHPKEEMDIFLDGSVLRLIDYKTLTEPGRGTLWTSVTVEKGQLEELQCLAHCLEKGGPWPISAEDQFGAARTSFQVEAQI